MADSKSTSPDQAGQNPAPSTGGFSLSGLCDHKTGWGPTQVELPDFNGVQFLPFNKSDRIGRVSELSTGSSYSRKGNYTQTFTGQPNIFQYQRLDDKDFKFVAKDLPKPRRRFGRKKFQNRSRFGLRRGRNPVQKRPGGRAGMAKRMSKRNRLRFQGRRRRYERDERIREPSVSARRVKMHAVDLASTESCLFFFIFSVGAGREDENLYYSGGLSLMMTTPTNSHSYSDRSCPPDPPPHRT